MSNMAERMMTTAEAAAYLGIKPGTMTVWRHRKRGPRYTKIGAGIIRYSKADLDAFVEVVEPKGGE